MARLLILSAVLLLPHAFALIGSKQLSVDCGSPEQIDAFAFQSGGTFALSITATAPSNFTGESLLLLVQRGAHCDQITKHCTFDLLRLKNVCNAVPITEVYSKITHAFPIVVPYSKYYPLNKATFFEFNVTDWLVDVHVPETYSVKSFIDEYVTSTTISKMKDYVNLSEDSNDTSPLSLIMSNASGFATGQNHLSFIVLSCSNTSIKLDVNYQFLNPEGEHLPVSDLPFKVIHQLFACLWGIATFVQLIMIVIERIQRKSYRLIHIMLLVVCLLFVFMHVVFHIYWQQVSAQGYSDEKLDILKSSAMLSVTLFCILLIVITSTGVMLASRVMMRKDILIIVVILTLYGIFAMLYAMYGSVTNFFVALIYMVCLVYVCMRVAQFISQTEVLMWDLQHNRSGHLLRIPNRKVQIMFWFRMYSLLLLSALLVGNIIALLWFSSYPWIPVVFDQSSTLVYFGALTLLFRSSSINEDLYADMPSAPPDLRVLRELALEYELRNDPIVQATRWAPERLTLIRLPFSTGEQVGLVTGQDEDEAKASTNR